MTKNTMRVEFPKEGSRGAGFYVSADTDSSVKGPRSPQPKHPPGLHVASGVTRMGKSWGSHLNLGGVNASPEHGGRKKVNQIR